MSIIDELKNLAHHGEEIATTGYTLRTRYDFYLDGKPTSANLADLTTVLGKLITEISVNALRELGEYSSEPSPGETEKDIAILYAQAVEVLAAIWRYETAEIIRRNIPERLSTVWGRDAESAGIDGYKRACKRLEDARHLDKALIAAIEDNQQAVAKHLGFFQHPQEGQK